MLLADGDAACQTAVSAPGLHVVHVDLEEGTGTLTFHITYAGEVGAEVARGLDVHAAEGKGCNVLLHHQHAGVVAHEVGDVEVVDDLHEVEGGVGPLQEHGVVHLEVCQ